MRITVSRKAHFNAAHRLHNPKFSKEKNEAIFGKCNNGNYHGHNYELEVFVSGEIDQETGYLIDLKVLSDIIKDQIEERFDHKNLNLDVPEFKDILPSTENFAYIIHRILSEHLDPSFSIRIKLWETPRNAAIYPAIQ